MLLQELDKAANISNCKIKPKTGFSAFAQLPG